MLVESMNEAEVLMELHKDTPSISTLSRLCEEYIKERKKKNIPKTATYQVYKSIKSKNKNNWIISYSKAPSANTFKGIESCTQDVFTYYYTIKGIRMFHFILDGGWSVFNGHVFTRYVERMNLELQSSLDKAKVFFTNNPIRHVQKIGENRIVAKCTDGYLLGSIINNYFILYKTFITNEQATAFQESIGRKLVSSLEARIQELISAEDWDRIVYEQTSDAFTVLK